MATYHLRAKHVSRGKGQSAIAAAAYRSAERLTDAQTGEVKDFIARRDAIAFEGIFAPKDAPDWARDRQQLWNHVEQFENRKDARLARELEISLPHEMTDQQREWLVKDFVRENFVRHGYAVDVAIHNPGPKNDERNFHAHLMVTPRQLNAEGFEPLKDFNLDRKEQLLEWREKWAALVNRHLERHGHESRIDHRSHEARDIEAEPSKFEGPNVTEMARRGEITDRRRENDDIRERNEGRLQDSQARELAEEERGHNAGIENTADDWTSRGGMVAQQESAVRYARDHHRVRIERPSEERAAEQMEKPSQNLAQENAPPDPRGFREGEQQRREEAKREGSAEPAGQRDGAEQGKTEAQVQRESRKSGYELTERERQILEAARGRNDVGRDRDGGRERD